MPSYGEKQKPCGVALQKEKPVIGKRVMTSKDNTITNSLVCLLYTSDAADE